MLKDPNGIYTPIQDSRVNFVDFCMLTLFGRYSLTDTKWFGHDILNEVHQCWINSSKEQICIFVSN